MNNIKAIRNRLKMTIRELAKKSKISVGYLSDLENNNKNNPSKDVMTNISSALSQSVQAVFFANDKKECS